MKIKVAVASHKLAKMPTDKVLYVPIQVGKQLHPDLKLPYQPDNIGDNISAKNTTYNELTALYWIWKNTESDALGLVHYRRLLSLNHRKDYASVLSNNQAQRLLQETDIILPKKRHYYIESNYSHYVHAHESEPLDASRQIIEERYPEYLISFDKAMAKRSAHMFNIFIMKRELADAYCTWMFDILDEIDSRVDMTNYNDYEKRAIGFVSELLLDVWLDKHGYKYKEVNCLFMEKQNWLKKGGRFLLRKITGYHS